MSASSTYPELIVSFLDGRNLQVLFTYYLYAGTLFSKAMHSSKFFLQASLKKIKVQADVAYGRADALYAFGLYGVPRRRS